MAQRKRQHLAQAVNVSLSQVPSRPAQLRAFRHSTLVRRFGTGKTGRFGEALIRPDVQRPYRQALDAAITVQDQAKAWALQKQRAAGTSLSRVQAEVEQILAEAGRYVTQAFLEISDAAQFVEDIRLEAEAGTNDLRVALRLANGLEAEPEEILSEANLDLLSLLLFVAIAEASIHHGLARLLVLDDVFQSVDAVFRDRACRYVIGRLRDWQLFITTHDRLWFALLAEALRQEGVPYVAREIVRWSFDEGPLIREAEFLPGSSLTRALKSKDPLLICAAAGVTAEEVADRLSWTLGTSVQRRRGDRYTLGELWPGVLKKLKRTNGAPLAVALDETLPLRNLVGAHFNEWARSVSLSEATRFGENMQELLGRVFCADGETWIQSGLPNATAWTCRCGQTRVGPPTTAHEDVTE